MKKTGVTGWFSQLPIQDPVNRRMASLVQIMLIGFMAIIATATILNLFLRPPGIPMPVLLLRGASFITVVGIPLFLLRRGHFHTSIFFIIGIFLILETFAAVSGDLRSIAETLTFFTLAILLAGLLVGRRALLGTFVLSAGVVLLGAFLETDHEIQRDNIAIAGNFILLNGLMSIFLDRFGIVLRQALGSALTREEELRSEVDARVQTEEALRQSTERLEILHEIDRSLLAAQSPEETAMSALERIRQLIPCPRASVTLFDFGKKEATFLTADFDGMETVPASPIPLAEYGLDVIEALRQNEPWITTDMLNEPLVTNLDRHLADEYGIHAWLSVPLLYQGELIGALNLGRGPGGVFTREEAGIAHDVANQLAIVLQQTNLYDALQAELAERQKLIADLEASNAELERFTYTVSHDLRNPLVTIKGFLGMLEKDLHNGRVDKVQEDLERISSAADKMNELLADLLELSRIGRILNPLEEIHLVDLARDAVEMLDAHLRSRNATVVISAELPVVTGDRIRLREVFENLIDNAVKYMGEQPHPVIEIGVRDGDSGPILYVKDNGIGIEAPYQSKVFALFEQLDPAIEGTGIGLALVKRIIETHGGKIWIESEGFGQGSMFCFTIPSYPQTPQQGADE